MYFHSRRVTRLASSIGASARRQTVTRKSISATRELNMRPKTMTIGSNADTAILSAIKELLQRSTAPKSASPACTDNET